MGGYYSHESANRTATATTTTTAKELPYLVLGDGEVQGYIGCILDLEEDLSGSGLEDFAHLDFVSVHEIERHLGHQPTRADTSEIERYCMERQV